MKKTLALILSLALTLSSMTVGVFAAADENPSADPAVDVLDESVPADQDVQGGDVVTEQPEGTNVDPVPEATDPVPEATDPAPEADAVLQHEEDVAKNSLLESTDGFTANADPLSSTSATISWDYPADADVASVEVVGYGEPVTDGTKSLVVNGLTPGTQPTFTVRFTLGNGDTVDKEAKLSEALPIGKVSNFATYSAYKSVALEWDIFPGATSYNVYRNGNCVARNINSKAYDSDKRSYIDKTGDESETKYSYYVSALGPDGKEIAKSDTISDASVTQLYITVTFKKTRKLKSHDSAHKKRTFKKGTKVQCHSFKFGKYIFYDDKGHLYYCNYLSLKKFKANLAKGAPTKLYSDKEAEYFAMTSGRSSSTNYMIWANLYSQHLYVFQRVNGYWRVANVQYKSTAASNWGISSGKASSPSPAGMDFTLKKHKKTQRGVKWLTFYHSQTSLHGKVGKQDFRTLRSGGCIRNPDKYAELIYKAIPLKTRLIVY